jgi:hypothetical protein
VDSVISRRKKGIGPEWVGGHWATRPEWAGPYWFSAWRKMVGCMNP